MKGRIGKSNVGDRWEVESGWLPGWSWETGWIMEPSAETKIAGRELVG